MSSQSLSPMATGAVRQALKGGFRKRFFMQGSMVQSMPQAGF